MRRRLSVVHIDRDLPGGPLVEEAVARYDFAGASRILDVGGGRGHFVRAALNAHPWLEGAVFDVPEVAEATDRELRRTGFDDRCVAIGGSFFEALPGGYDLHVLKWILHEWNDASCRRILDACRAALPGRGRLLVIEPGSDWIPDARGRRLGEYEQLLAGSGFAIAEVLPLPSGFSLLEARPR
jgi:O-methyltransferase domain